LGQVRLYEHDANSTTVLRNPYIESSQPDISGDNVVWLVNTGAGYEIMFYDGITTTMLTNSVYWNDNPAVSGSKAVWHRYFAWRG
jgi:hypothetical protein